MPLFLPAVRSARDVLASSLLLLVPWSMFAAAALASQGAWTAAAWAVAPSAAVGALVLATAGLHRVQREDDEDADDGDGGEPVDPGGPPPREPHGVALDWDAFDEARTQWREPQPA